MGPVTARLLRRLGDFNAVHPWSHNDFYIPWVMRHVRAVRRRGGSRALDVGCGTGELLMRLAAVMEDVSGVEPDSRTAQRARQNLAGMGTVTVREASFEAISLDRSSYDVVTFVAVLHHLPLRQTLAAARALLRPGGRLVVVGLARETSADVPWSLMSMILNPVIGMIRHPRRAHAVPENMTAPTAEPRDTFEQISVVANELLPGTAVRRRLFWRYTAVWTAPAFD